MGCFAGHFIAYFRYMCILDLFDLISHFNFIKMKKVWKALKCNVTCMYLYYFDQLIV